MSKFTGPKGEIGPKGPGIKIPIGMRGIDYDDIWFTIDGFESDILVTWVKYNEGLPISLNGFEGKVKNTFYGYGFTDPFGSGEWVTNISNKKPSIYKMKKMLREYILSKIL